MRTQLSTLALMAALVAVAFVSLPSEARAQHGHYYGHGYGHGYGGYGYGVTTHMDTGRTVPTTETSGLKWVRSTSAMKLKST